jgi:hypothetical protein
MSRDILGRQVLLFLAPDASPLQRRVHVTQIDGARWAPDPPGLDIEVVNLGAEHIRTLGCSADCRPWIGGVSASDKSILPVDFATIRLEGQRLTGVQSDTMPPGGWPFRGPAAGKFLAGLVNTGRDCLAHGPGWVLLSGLSPSLGLAIEFLVLMTVLHFGSAIDQPHPLDLVSFQMIARRLLWLQQLEKRDFRAADFEALEEYPYHSFDASGGITTQAFDKDIDDLEKEDVQIMKRQRTSARRRAVLARPAPSSHDAVASACLGFGDRGGQRGQEGRSRFVAAGPGIQSRDKNGNAGQRV